MNDDHLAQLEAIANQLVASGKGILAADESHGTCEKRFKALNVECTETTRQSYRQTIVTAPGLEDAVAGIILFDETLRQSTTDGVAFTKVLADKGILAGIKVDQGSKEHALFEGEQMTFGLDTLRDRLVEYKALGAAFAKWREVIVIDTEKELPTVGNIYSHAFGLAHYAALCQEAGIVPIVEPEILMDGSHTLEESEAIHQEVLAILFEVLDLQNIHFPGMILKPSMVMSGVDSKENYDPQLVAEATLRVLNETVPADVPGIAFLSGGQSPEMATDHLRRMNHEQVNPWKVTFSFGRAIQQPALEAWALEKDINKAQSLLVERACLCGSASLGK